MDITHSSCPRIALELCLLEMIGLRQALPLEEALEQIQALSVGRPQPTGDRPAPRGTRVEAAAVTKTQPRKAQTPPTSPAAEPAAGGPTGDGAEFVEFVRGQYVPAVSHLQQGTINLDGDKLRIQVSQSFHADWLRESDARTRLGELATEFFGRPVAIEVEETVKKKSPENDRLAKRREAERNALHNPIVQRVVETFQGKVVEVKTDG